MKPSILAAIIASIFSLLSPLPQLPQLLEKEIAAISATQGRAPTLMGNSINFFATPATTEKPTLAITGIEYTVKRGDTIESIAEDFNRSASAIEIFNDLGTTSLTIGSTIIIPDLRLPK